MPEGTAFDVYRQVDGTFVRTTVKADEFLRESAPPPGSTVGVRRLQKTTTAPKAQLMLSSFADWKLYEESPGVPAAVLNCMSAVWDYPSILWDKVCRAANGYGGAARHIDSDGVTLDTSWFHFLIKQLDEKVFRPFPGYQWYEMSFYIYARSTGAAVVFCFDTPPIFKNNLIQTMKTARSDRPNEALDFLQSIIVGEIVRLYDRSIWTLRDHIRRIEKERNVPGFLNRDLTPLHDLARHTIHTCEILAVAVDTVSELMGDYRPSSGRACTCLAGADGAIKKTCAHNELSFWLKLLRNFGLRAEALKARLLNEINLGFNVIVQRDSSSMKAVAVVTLAVLPATFVSTVFSMSFFSQAVDDNTGTSVWLVSDKFWIYWAFAVPLTIVTLAWWTYTQNRVQLLQFLATWRKGP